MAALALQLQQVHQLAAANGQPSPSNPAAIAGLGLPLYPPPNATNQNPLQAPPNMAPPGPNTVPCTSSANHVAPPPSSQSGVALTNGGQPINALSAALAANQQNNMALAAAALVAGAGLSGKY